MRQQQRPHARIAKRQQPAIGHHIHRARHNIGSRDFPDAAVSTGSIRCPVPQSLHAQPPHRHRAAVTHPPRITALHQRLLIEQQTLRSEPLRAPHRMWPQPRMRRPSLDRLHRSAPRALPAPQLRPHMWAARATLQDRCDESELQIGHLRPHAVQGIRRASRSTPIATPAGTLMTMPLIPRARHTPSANSRPVSKSGANRFPRARLSRLQHRRHRTQQILQRHNRYGTRIRIYQRGNPKANQRSPPIAQTFLPVPPPIPVLPTVAPCARKYSSIANFVNP